MTYLANLTTTRDNIAAQLADISANPKPSYSIDGQTVRWAAHRRALWAELAAVNKEINAADPADVHSVGYT